MVLRAADIEGRPDEDVIRRQALGMVGDDLRAQRIRADEAVRPVLFERADGDDDGL